MAFVDIVDDVVTLAKTVVVEDEMLRQKHGLKVGIRYGDPKTNEYLKEADGLRNKLNDYLNTLSNEDLGKLETVMYFGRDPEDVHENDISDYHKQLHSSGFDKKNIIRNIGGITSSLGLYFSDAYKKAAQLSIDLETII